MRLYLVNVQSLDYLFLMVAVLAIALANIYCDPNLYEAERSAGFPFLLYTSNVLFVPIAEELLFRHLFLNKLLRKYANPYAAIGVTSLLFGLCHFDSMTHVLFATLLGLLLGYTYYKTHALWVCVVMHAFFNACVMVYGIYLGPTAL